MRKIFIPLVMVLSLLLAGCASAAKAQPPATAIPAFATEPLPTPKLALQTGTDLARVDEQGMVVVEVTPLNLDNAADTVTLDFEVAMNTHSVDLSMDLAHLATLTTDTGVSVQATKWDATPGGHHVSGKLIFPARKDGKGVLEGATKLTLTIDNVDASSRVFEWQLQ
jgi:hypothetical protein